MAIELNKLRLGNFVFDDENKIMKVARIETSEYTKWNSGENFSIIIENLIDKNNYYISEINAIPITEEWLLKLGFNKVYKKGYIGIDVNHSDFVLTEPKIIGDWQDFYVFQFTAGNVPKFKALKYVHELQNLYFALTDEELKI
jgi:hypothetical protein